MGLIRFIQDHNRNVHLRDLKNIERSKYDVQRQKEQQNRQSKQVFCPHCGKSFTIEV